MLSANDRELPFARAALTTPRPGRTLRQQIRDIYRKDLVFLVGMPKSGTTWLQLLLDSHPGIACRGEAHFVDIFYLELSRQLDRYNREVMQQGGIVAHHEKFGGHVEHLDYNMGDANTLLVQAMGLMFARWAARDDITLIGEKTPDNLQYLALLSSLFPEARFIHIIRDPRDCAISGWQFQLSNLDSNKRVIQTFDNYALNFARSWEQHVQQARHIGHDLGNRYLELTYEDLVSATGPQLARVLEFLRIATSPQEIDRCVAANAFQVLSGGRNPGDEDNSQFIRKGVVGDWKNHFSASLARDFHAVAGAAMDALGYDDPPRT